VNFPADDFRAPHASRARDSFAAEVLALIPAMRAYATALTGSRDKADDVVQESLFNAFRARAQFTGGTNLRAWLFRIVRNRFLNVVHSQRHEVEDADGVFAGSLTSAPSQEAGLDYAALLAALGKLRPEHRDMLSLLATGSDYEEIVEISGLPMGTVKSRIHRARLALLAVLGDGGPAVAHGRAAWRRLSRPRGAA
jgi:RNA polymerase sigma-70 factor (ECF subfamily)